MPSKSPKQKRFMAAAAHSPGFAKRADIKPGVAKEFHKADKGKIEFKKDKENTKGKKKAVARF